MDREETLEIMAVLRAAYPAYYRGQGKEDAKAAVNLWHKMFADDPYPVVSAAVEAHIASDTKGYPPHIGAIRDKITKLTQPEELSEMEAWALVRKALSNSGYHAQQEFDKLPEVLQRVVGSPSMLHQWALMDNSDVETVVQSNFMRSYKVRAASAKEYLALPAEVKAFMRQIADQHTLALEDGE